MKILLLALAIFIISPYARSKDRGFALSGGVSLGIYEGGVFYSLIEQNRETLPRELKVVFGTSAGSINGLIGIFEVCGFRKSNREANLFWKMWIPNGLDDLEARKGEGNSLLSRRASQPLFEELRERWKEGFREECDLHFGVAAARREPYVDELKAGLEVIRQSEFFAVRIRGRGKGRPPLVENQQYASTNSYRTYLPLGESPEKDLEHLLSMIQASSSFPGAFGPYPISFCYSHPGQQMKECRSQDAETKLFIDGGIFHNGPVGYAYEALHKTSKDKNFELNYINASAPLKAQKGGVVKTIQNNPDVFKDFQDLFSNMIVQARRFELDKSLETNPDIVDHLRLRPKSFPLASDPLYAFAGFFEKDFRRSDFFLGMYDGETSTNTTFFTDDPEYSCFRDRLRGKEDCELDNNLKVLIGMAKYRLGKKVYEGDFDKLYVYLEKNHFEFKALGLGPEKSRYGRVYTKDRLTKLLKRFADRQPKRQKNKFKHFIRPSLNYLRYTPLKDFYYGVYASSAEVGYSRIIPENYLENSSFRFDLIGMLNGISSFFGREPDVWAFTPLLGLEYEPLWLNGAVFQWRAGLRAGYVLSPQDDFGRKHCNTELADKTSAACSGTTIQAMVALSLFERLRLQLVYIPFAANTIALDERPEVIVQIGLQFGESF